MLDEKLKEIRISRKVSPSKPIVFELSEDEIAQIKQAFAEELGINELFQDMQNLVNKQKIELARLMLTPTSQLKPVKKASP